MPNTNAQVREYANRQVRPTANLLVAAYRQAKAVNDNFNAGNIGDLINTAGPGEIIVDGSEDDGRTQIVGGDVYNFINGLQAFIAFCEANGSAVYNDFLKPHTDL